MKISFLKSIFSSEEETAHISLNSIKIEINH